MMRKVIKYGAFAVCTLLLLGLTGCGNTENSSKEYALGAASTIESGIVAENENYVLKYDDEKQNVVLEAKETGASWSTTPIDYEGEDMDVLSSLKIEVINNIAKTKDFDRSYTSCVQTGDYSVVKSENGITITYYFDAYQISVPVNYELREDSLKVSVNTEEICEGEDYRLLSVDLAPFLGAVENDAKDSYLMVPSANGALMYTDARTDGTRTYAGEVYGTDVSRVNWEKPIAEDTIKMPVFGIKNGDTSLFAIVEENAEATVIHGAAGNAATGYSNAYASVSVRGYDIYADEIDSNSTTTIRNADNMKAMTVSVAYYPLQGEDADYNGMAKLYKAYLEKQGMQKTENDDLYAVTMLGGIRTRSLLFGVPYYSVKSMTSFEEAAEILQGLSAAAGSYPSVQLVGFGESGINVGKVAGGFKFNKVSGGEKAYQSVETLAAEQDFLLSVDFDLIRFNKSSGAANTWMDAAKSSSLFKTVCYYNNIALGDYNKDSDSYYLVTRTELDALVDKLVSKTQKMGISGVSLSTLGQYAYSDYTEEQYYTKGNTETTVTGYLQKLKENDLAVVTDNANIYAAVNSDSVFNVIVETAELNAIDDYIPFYQMVLHGTKPLYSEALNLTTNEDKNLLRALESGVKPGYTLIGNYDTSYANSVHMNLFNSLYEDVEGRIAQHLTDYAAYYAAIENASIDRYEIVEPGVSKTVFDNGIVAYTNQTDKDVETDQGTLKAMSFSYKKGE